MPSDHDPITVTISGFPAAELRRVVRSARLITERAVSTLAGVAMLRGLPNIEADLLASPKERQTPYEHKPQAGKRARQRANDSQRVVDVVPVEMSGPGHLSPVRPHESEDSSPHFSDEERVP